MNSFRPKVTILIPVYNGANYLAESISSALAQTYDNKEVIVVNDGSRDDGATEKVAQSFGDKIRYFSKPNGGVASALNFGFTKANGDYVSWLSHDDLYSPEKVASQVQHLAKMEDRTDVILYSDYSLFSTSGGTLGDFRMQGVPPEDFRFWITHQSSLHGCTLLIPQNALDYAKFNETLKCTQDYDLWFRLASKFKFVHMPGVLVKGRQHPEQDSVKKAKLARAEGNQFLTYCIQNLTTTEMERGSGLKPVVAYAATVGCQLQRGYGWAAFEAFKLSVRQIPGSKTDDIIAWAVTLVRTIPFRKFLKPVIWLLPKPVKVCVRRWVSALPSGLAN